MFTQKQTLGMTAILLSIWACKPLVREKVQEFQPSATTSEDGRDIARQMVLLVNAADNSIDERLLNDPELEQKLDQIMLTRGRTDGISGIVDKMRDFFFSLPAKLLLWNRNIGDGELHEDAETAVKLALLEGDSLDTHISVNEYNPKLIWSRTFKNDKVSFLSKVSLGTLHAIIYTVKPRKLFGGDAYFSIADTVVLYSDNLDVALHEAGHAIDFADKHRQGIGAGLYTLGSFAFPIRLYQEAVATGKAFEFTTEHGAPEDVRSSYALLFPAFGTYLAMSILAANKFISKAKIKRGQEATALTKWFEKRTDALVNWQAQRGRITPVEHEQAQAALRRYGQDAYRHLPRSVQKAIKRSRRVLNFTVVIPVVVAAHIVGRVMGVSVKTNNDQPINPKFD